MLVLAMLFWLIPPGGLILASVIPSLVELSSAAVAATGLSVLFWMLISQGMRIPAFYGVGYPFGVLVALFIILRSTWRGGRRVEWRGRVYSEKSLSGKSEARKR